MQSNSEDRYHQAVTELGARKLWYQTGNDLLYAAVVAAVEGVKASEILSRSEALGETLPRSHDLHLVRSSVAAVSAACELTLSLSSHQPTDLQNRCERPQDPKEPAESPAPSVQHADHAT